MKITEIIQEAHHFSTGTVQIGQWTVDVDSHAVVSAAHRKVPMELFSNIITYMCFMPDVLPTIPVNKGAYFQDMNSLVSLFVKRTSENSIRVETVLGPDMKPKPPLFRRSIPAPTHPASKRLRKGEKLLHKASQEKGRDAVSQELQQQAELRKSLNREQRRRLDKLSRRSK